MNIYQRFPLKNVYISIMALFLTFRNVYTWNLDVSKQAVYKHLSDTAYFGYSLAVHDESTKLGTVKKILVGAPAENIFNGNIYKCSINSYLIDSFDRLNCSKVAVKGRTTAPDGWFGATVLSSEGSATVCAPRAGKQVSGECFSSVKGLSLMRVNTSDDKREYCLTGFSATYLPNTTEAFFGGPSCLTTKWLFANMTSYSVYPSEERYVGYAMASGTYGKSGWSQTKFLIASIGLNTNTSFAGKVIFVNIIQRKIEERSLIGQQPGEHFGASLAVGDFNGDNLDDIIVGAPHHTDYGNMAPKFEIGAVYIYYQKPGKEFYPSEFVLRGQVTGSRFGLAVAAIGDTDADGYNDLAVGAPYENDGSGTVYIFQGSLNGLSSRPSQTIMGNSFASSLSMFGSAFTAFDFDGNGYNDLVVGAFNSSAIAYFPARPIIRDIFSQLSFVQDIIQLGKTNKCYSDSKTSEESYPACNEVKYCLSYSGKGVPKVKMNVSLVLDINSDKSSRRTLFIQNHNDELSRETTLEEGKQKCDTLKFYVKSKNIDPTTVVQAKMIIQPTFSRDHLLLPIIRVEESTTIISNKLSIFAPNDTPWWQYLAGGVGAVVILAFLTAILYKMGFFKRKLPPTEEQDVDQQTNVSTSLENDAEQQ